DEHPDMGIRGPRSLGGSAVTLVLQVPDVDATAAQAVAAGAKAVFPVKDQFYGERSGRFEDPFGHVWILSTHIRDMSTAEMQQRYEQLLVEQPESSSVQRRRVGRRASPRSVLASPRSPGAGRSSLASSPATSTMAWPRPSVTRALPR